MPSVFLIGPMGAGKTTIGRKLSDKLKCPFYDSDHYIEDRCGADIPWIFDVEGEAGFRQREVQAIDDLTQKKDIILATGGGCILREENRHHLLERGIVIYLCASINQQVRRTNKDKNRPLLQTANPKQTLTQLFEQRDPLYRSVAHLIIETDGKNPKHVLRIITDFLDDTDAHTQC